MTENGRIVDNDGLLTTREDRKIDDDDGSLTTREDVCQTKDGCMYHVGDSL
jgi:hypothetical protein